MPRPISNRTFRALRGRNYRLFFGGQFISMMGTWMQQVAVGWLVYRLTGSAAWLGTIGFITQIPSFVVTPVAGTLADAWNRHRMLVTTQVLAMTQALVLAALTITGHISVVALALLSLWAGLVSAVDVPVRQSFVPELVDDPEDLANAIALNSSLMNGARLVGPAVAGLLIAWVGEGGVFLLNGLSYIAVIIALLRMRLPVHVNQSQGNGLLADLLEGWQYATRSLPIRAILIFVSMVSFASYPVQVLLPVMASKVLQGGPNTLGLLMAANGLGALTAALLLARRRHVTGLGRWVVAGGLILGVGMALFAASRSLPLSMALLVVSGFGMMTQMAGCNTVLQTLVEPQMRGRVMSLYTLAFFGTMPFGSLGAGALANRIGTPLTLALGGLICALAAGVMATQLPRLRQIVRPIYRERGVLPPENQGKEAS